MSSEKKFEKMVEEDLLNITSVHPMREDGVRTFLQKANAGWEAITRLISEKKLVEIEYNGKKFT